MFRKNSIPQHIGIKTRLNQKLSAVDDRDICVAKSSQHFNPKADTARRILVNNFNAAMSLIFS